MNGQRLTLLMIFAALCLGPLGRIGAAEMTEQQLKKAQQVLRELAADQATSTMQEAALSEAERQAWQQLRSAEVSLLEAKAWLDRGLPAEAGQAFLQSGVELAAIEEIYYVILQPRLDQAHAARLRLARSLLENDYLTPPVDPDEAEAEAEQAAALATDPATAVEGTTVEGTTVEGTTVEGTTVEGTTVDAAENSPPAEAQAPAAKDAESRQDHASPSKP